MLIGYVRMPLFTFLSGYVYAAFPVNWGSLPSFLHKKALRLLVPMVVVAPIFLMTKMYAPGVHDRSVTEVEPFFLLYPYEHFWYLQALMLVFIAIAVLEASGLLASLAATFTILALAGIAFDFRLVAPEFFSFSKALYLFPYFIAGLMLARFGVATRAASLGPITLFALYEGVALALGGQTDIDSGLYLLVGCAAAIALVRWTPPFGPLSWVGGYSYTIYLYHVFGYSAARVVLQRVGATDLWALFLLTLAAGIVLSIAFHLLVYRVPLLRRALLGVRPRRSTGRFNADRRSAELPNT